MAWDATLPADNEAISQGASRIRTLKSDLAAALTAEGSFPVDASNPKFYVKLNKGTTAARPAASSDYPGRPYVNSTTGSLQRVKDDGSGWEDVMLSPSSAAIHAAVPISIASSSGVVTLTEGGNSFYCSGTEAVTSIEGWSAGRVVIRWTQARIITHGSSLILKNALSRNVVAGDISIFEFFGSNQVREISFYGAGMGTEVGEVKAFGGSTVPDGFLECDGSSLLRADYPGLFARIGTAHGAADGTHFNIPDMRGKFVRGWAHGQTTDPDAASRTANASGGATGDNVGSVQADELKSHTHTISFQNSGADSNAGGPNENTAGATFATSATGGNETRPVNVNLMYIIKF